MVKYLRKVRTISIQKFLIQKDAKRKIFEILDLIKKDIRFETTSEVINIAPKYR